MKCQQCLNVTERYNLVRSVSLRCHYTGDRSHLVFASYALEPCKLILLIHIHIKGGRLTNCTKRIRDFRFTVFHENSDGVSLTRRNRCVKAPGGQRSSLAGFPLPALSLHFHLFTMQPIHHGF